MSGRSLFTSWARPTTRAFLIGGAGLAIGAIALPPAAGAVTTALHVIIDNNDANPVPVSGTVNVANLPAPVAEPKPTPFEARAEATVPAGAAFASASVAIPAGQQLTAEFLSVQVIVPPDQVPRVFFNALNGATGGFVPLNYSGTVDGLNGPVSVYTAALPIRDIQSETFEVSLVRDLPGSAAFPEAATLSAYVSGHLSAA